MNTRLAALALTALITLSFTRVAEANTAVAPYYTPPVTAQSSTEFTLAQAMAQRTVAVVDFNNDTGSTAYDNLKRGISESLMTKLARRPELILVERGQLSKAIQELGFSQSVYASGTEAKAIGKMAGASYLVTGNVVKAGERFEINVRMLDVETAKVLVSESYPFRTENDILPVVDYLSLLIPRKLGLYVSDRELDMAQNQLRSNTLLSGEAPQDNSWIWWTAGGVVLAAALIGTIIYVAQPRVNISQTTTINGRDRTPIADRIDNRTQLNPTEPSPQWNMPLLNF
jgi:TolB-like protein